MIGGGGFGTVYLIDNKTVMKAIYEESCKDAELEFLKQEKIYNSFVKLKKIHSDDSLVNLVQQYVVVSKPIEYSNKSIKIDGINYSCSIKMSKLNGIPLNILQDIDSELIQNIDKDFANEKGQNFQLMTHLTFEGIFNGVIGIDVDNKIGNDNPPRGYYITENSKTLTNLRKIGLALSNKKIKRIIGFIYGWIYYSSKIIPVDIEIALGMKNKEFVINVLDFGMVFDLENLNNNKAIPRTEEIFNILNKNISDDKKQDLLLRKLKYDVSLDMYGDLESDKDVIHGFDKAYNTYVKSVDTCKRISELTGEKCKRSPQDKSKYCWQHSPNK